MIQRRLIRVVPAKVSAESEDWWRAAIALHPDWEHITLRDPIDPSGFPRTSQYWDECESGAQLADLVRAEELYWRGGCYIDSDVEVYRPFDPLLRNLGFAAWEDDQHIPNAVMGFTPHHPALDRVLELAVDRRTQGTWHAGVGVTTEVFKDRLDMLLLPPGSFYPVHYRIKNAVDHGQVQELNPWAFCNHRWRHSWA